MIIIRIESDNVVNLEKFFDRVDLVYQEGADVTASFFDPDGTAIAAATDLEMAQVAGTTGRDVVYRCEVADTATTGVAEGDGTALIVATNVAGKVRRFLEDVRYQN